MYRVEYKYNKEETAWRLYVEYKDKDYLDAVSLVKQCRKNYHDEYYAFRLVKEDINEIEVIDNEPKFDFLYIIFAYNYEQKKADYVKYVTTEEEAIDLCKRCDNYNKNYHYYYQKTKLGA